MEDSDASPMFPPPALPSTSADTFIPPSIHQDKLANGDSYAHYTPLPPSVTPNPPPDAPLTGPGTPCTLGIDEAGRGPVIGPMIYGVFYLPTLLHPELLTTAPYVFNDSKVLTPSFRAELLYNLCDSKSKLGQSCGWAVKSLSARDISSGMLRRRGTYNLNQQAMDATIELVKGVLERGVNVREIYVDALGPEVTYQKKLERIFPNIKIKVEKKADALYPVVSAASVVAKVTRDISSEQIHNVFLQQQSLNDKEDGDAKAEGRRDQKTVAGWGSGYPSDGRCIGWMEREMDPIFGWGAECRFSWGTAKDRLEARGKGAKGKTVDWPTDDAGEGMRITDHFSIANGGDEIERPTTEEAQLRRWFGNRVGQEAF